jgi:hypothetical protein
MNYRTQNISVRITKQFAGFDLSMTVSARFLRTTSKNHRDDTAAAASAAMTTRLDAGEMMLPSEPPNVRKDVPPRWNRRVFECNTIVTWLGSISTRSISWMVEQSPTVPALYRYLGDWCGRTFLRATITSNPWYCNIVSPTLQSTFRPFLSVAGDCATHGRSGCAHKHQHHPKRAWTRSGRDRS